MNKENFEKGVKGLREIRMTNVEKARMLERIFAMPIQSPYMRRIPLFAYVYCLFFIISLSGATYVSGTSIPGDLLYPIKTRVVETALDVVNYAPEDAIIWEEEKVIRRIAEAEELVEKDMLDEKKLKNLEKRIEKSSRNFVTTADNLASSTELRDKFRKRLEINDDDEKESRDEKSREKKEKIKRLKNRAIRVLENEGDEEDRKREERRKKSD